MAHLSFPDLLALVPQAPDWRLDWAAIPGALARVAGTG